MFINGWQGHRLRVIICLLVSNQEKTCQQNLLTWPLRYLIFAWWEFAWSLFAEGAGSLQALLKKRGWGRSVVAGCGDNGHETNSVTFNFTVTISLTSHGLEHVWKHDILPLCIVVALYVAGAKVWLDSLCVCIQPGEITPLSYPKPRVNNIGKVLCNTRLINWCYVFLVCLT